MTCLFYTSRLVKKFRQLHILISYYKGKYQPYEFPIFRDLLHVFKSIPSHSHPFLSIPIHSHVFLTTPSQSQPFAPVGMDGNDLFPP